MPAAAFLERWQLRRDGPSRRGAVAEVLPVRRLDGSPAVLKLQPVDEETAGEPVALRAWAGHGAVRLLDHDPATGTMLLERLDPARSLGGVPDPERALAVLAGLAAQLTAAPAPAELPRLGDLAAGMLDRAPPALAGLPDADDRRLLRRCAAVVTDLLPEPGDRLLHGDLHYDNVLARLPGPELAGRRGRWLAIDPKPLAGDPGFELLPALRNRWAEVVATGKVARAVRRRFDLLVDRLGLDRERAAGWTLARVLQNRLWDLEDGHAAPDPVLTAIAYALFTPGVR